MKLPDTKHLRRYQVFAAFLLGLGMTACSTLPGGGSNTPAINGFDDAVHHWQNRYGTRYPRYETSQVREIADNILLMQRNHGGWVQNQDPLKILSDFDREEYLFEKDDAYGSFDNRNVYTQIEYLMGAFERLGDEKYRAGAMKGLDYLLAHQIERCGGWPHSVPTRQSYHPHLTIADEVTSGPLTLLRRIAEKQWPFGQVSRAKRFRSDVALKFGDACILRLQVRQEDGLAAWAGQYDRNTLEPVMGRSFELPSMAVDESVSILRYLMSIPDPSEEVIASVEGGVAWLDRVKIEGMKLIRVELDEPVEFRFHTARFDRQLVPDPEGGAIWARFYDVTDNSVVLANRDSIRVDRYEDITMERRTGYNWYGTWPARLLEVDYPAWRARVYGEE